VLPLLDRCAVGHPRTVARDADAARRSPHHVTKANDTTTGQLSGETMQHTATTARELQRPPHTPPEERLTREARAWLKRRLDWERRLVELRTQADRYHGMPTAAQDRDTVAGAPR
jgi:endonuclease YncB( thermonuclease family)